MKSNYKQKLVIVGLSVLVAFLYLVANVGAPQWWPIKQKLNYGLDIQGGLHLVMGIDMPSAVKDMLAREKSVIESALIDEGIAGVTVTQVDATEPQLVVQATSADQILKIKEAINKQGEMLLEVEQVDSKITFQLMDAFLLDFKTRVVQQAIETIRNRIDEFGVAEPLISAQGDDRILVQLPGMSDAETAKKLISAAAKLDFMKVEDRSPEELMALIKEAETAGEYSLEKMKYSEYIVRLNNDLKSKLPENTEILFEKAENAVNMESGRTPFLLSTTGLGGNDLDDARVSFDQFNNPEVSLRFNASGTQKFRELTSKSVGQRVAVVLDRVVKTAPVIKVEIPNGQAVITLGSTGDRQQTMNEAKMIATSLRAGALPASLEQLEERRIGPTLGAESLKQAQMASLIGAFAVIAIMIYRYRLMGVISSLGLVLNISIILAVLSALKATLTLPGIAGMALTAGVAVDANVLIFERIREELAKGSSFVMSFREGYAKAISAILDANVVVGVTSFILLYFGTGPVRGFAVTLLTGIVSTLFAQVFVTRAIVEWLVVGRKNKSLSI